MASVLNFHLAIKAEGLTFTQLVALHCVGSGIQTGRKLSREMTVSESASSDLIERLLQMGLLSRGHTETDRRAKILGLTDAGRAKLGVLLDQPKEEQP